ncbi:hypothetical protein R3I94_002212 [Phoxinus phoxinus]
MKREHLDVADGSGSHTADVETMSPSGDLHLQLDPDETANMELGLCGHPVSPGAVGTLSALVGGFLL